MTTFFIKQGDTHPSIAETLLNDDESPIDLTSATVRFHLLSPTNTVKVDAAATIDAAITGDVSYNWQSADTDTAGEFLREWEVTLPSGEVVSVPNDRVGDPVIITEQIA